MATRARSCPLPRSQVVDLYYLEHRARLIDIAAFLDRVDRAQSDGQPEPDFRIVAFQQALRLLGDGQPRRARRVLKALSDPTIEPIASAAGMKGAAGAWRHSQAPIAVGRLPGQRRKSPSPVSNRQLAVGKKRSPSPQPSPRGRGGRK